MADEWILCPDRAWEVLSGDGRGGCHPKLPSGLDSLSKVKVTAGQECGRGGQAGLRLGQLMGMPLI